MLEADSNQSLPSNEAVLEEKKYYNPKHKNKSHFRRSPAGFQESSPKLLCTV